ncbi:restriction endonuclease subunit S [Streptococcus suis]|nr:restriction endonuclease subunit S [Streptococcus suis]
MTRMKDSGNPWIREIPGDWFEKKLRYLVELRGEKSVTTDYKKYVGLENIMSQTGQYVQTGIEVDLTENLTFEVGDILFGKLRPYLRKYWRAEFSGTASSEFVIIKGSSLNLNFLFWAIQSDSFINDVDSSTYGSKMPRASWEYMKNIKLPFPESIEEQSKIADFLDKKVAQLDKVKNLLEEQIKTLEDYRQSLIYETVTKGLDKTVSFKEVDNKWISVIPSDWEERKLRYLAQTRNEKILTENSDSYVGLENITPRTGLYIETESEVDLTENISFKQGDILFGKLRPYLRKFWKAEFDGTASSEFIIFKDSILDLEFLYWAIQSDSFVNDVNSSTYGSKMPRASWEYIKEIKIPFPVSQNEQKSIVKFLNEKVVQINQMIAIKKEQIENINKQRQTLIYDYVTGKRRV